MSGAEDGIRTRDSLPSKWSIYISAKLNADERGPVEGGGISFSVVVGDR